MVIRRLLVIGIGLFILLGSSVSTPASAPPPLPQLPAASACQKELSCRSVFEVAVRCYQEGDYETARDGFQSCIESSEDPVLLIHLGRSLAKLGRNQAAIDNYRKYQRAGVANALIPNAEVERDIAELQAKILAENLALSGAANKPSGAAAQPKPKPLYRRGFIWGLAGIGALGLSLGLGLGLGLPNVPVSHQTVKWNSQ